MTVAASIVALTLLLPPAGQAPAAEPTASTLAVKRGERVFVSRIAAPGMVSGRVLRLADDGLVLGDGRASETIPYRELQRVVRGKDSVWNGALIGYGVGFAAGAVAVLSDTCEAHPTGPYINVCFNQTAVAFAFGGVIAGPVGMVTGAIIDAFHKKPRVVFDRRSAPRAHVAVTAVLRRAGAGFHATVAF
ncbi:MAG TPA: hypothetical protein VKH34_17225 [Vicinamibacterales bacterium]|jgi:hypothetical protein|nr:hypothetical protein [Vicinamibacterales bacterium]